MLRKENLLIVPFVSGWREITIGYRYVNSSTTKYQYGYSLGAPHPYTPVYSMGTLSDTSLKDTVINRIYSAKATSEWNDYTEIGLKDWNQLPGVNILYLQLENGPMYSFSWKDKLRQYYKEDFMLFTENDVGKIMKIYVGTTPPP